jgi:hypothetical protein
MVDVITSCQGGSASETRSKAEPPKPAKHGEELSLGADYEQLLSAASEVIPRAIAGRGWIWTCRAAMFLDG